MLGRASFSVKFWKNFTPRPACPVSPQPKSFTSLLASEIGDFCSPNKSRLPGHHLLATGPGKKKGEIDRLAGCLKPVHAGSARHPAAQPIAPLRERRVGEPLLALTPFGR